MNTKIEKLSTNEMSQTIGGKGKWVSISGEWYWVDDRSLEGDFPPPPPSYPSNS